jgi:hypothetical protein
VTVPRDRNSPSDYRRRRDARPDPWAERARRDEADQAETRRRHEHLSRQQQQPEPPATDAGEGSADASQ